MKNTFFLTLATASLFSFSVSSFASDCEVPTAPIIPDGNVASEDELVAASKSIKGYQAQLGEYRTCLQDSQSKLDMETEEGTKQAEKLTEMYNASVDSETATAEDMNSAIRAYKERNQ